MCHILGQWRFNLEAVHFLADFGAQALKHKGLDHFHSTLSSYTGRFQVQVCLVTERAVQVHLSLVLKAFGPLISLMS